MDNIIGFAACVVDQVLMLFQWGIILMVIMSWLFTFNVLSPYGRIAGQVYGALRAITEPVLAPVRRFMPDMNGIDLSPVIVIILIVGLRSYILGPMARSAMSYF